MKEAVSKVAAVQFLPMEELTYIKILHRKGDKYFCGLKTYKDDLIEYKGATKFHSLDEVASFTGEALAVTKDNKVWRCPQIRTYSVESLRSGTLNTQAFNTDEEAEAKFNELVEKYNLTVI